MDRDMVRSFGRPKENVRKRHIRNTNVRFYEHNGKDDKGHWSVFEVCRRKNQIGEDCPPCDEKNVNVYNIGFFTVIDIGFAVGKEYQGNRNYYLCERRLLGAKRGSTEYPGALADIHRIREREGRLRGLVLHQIRKGKKSPTVGDSFEVIERLKPEPAVMMEFIKAAVMKLFKDGGIKRACDAANVGMPARDWYTAKFEKMVFDPAPYEEIFKPQTAAELANLFGLRYSGSGGQERMGDSPGEASGDKPFFYDDDPFQDGPGDHDASKAGSDGKGEVPF